MNRAWLVNGRLHVKCSACYSEGTPGGANISLAIPVTLSKQYDDFGKKLADRVTQFRAASTALHFNSQLNPAERTEKYLELENQLHKDLETLGATWPGRDQVKQIVTDCPWCNKPLNATIEE